VDAIACCLAHLAQRFEHIGIEHFVAEGPVEALDVGVPIPLARLDAAQLNTMATAPVPEDL